MKRMQQRPQRFLVRRAAAIALVAMLVAVFAPLAPASAQEGGSVTVTSHLCPADWGVEGITPKDLGAICDEPVEDPAFVTITGDGYTTSEKVAGTMSMFQGVPFGPLDIAHTAPRGYGNPAVFCADTFAGATAEDRMEVADGTTVRWELDPNAELWTTCEFFFMPVDAAGAAPSRISLVTWSCPAGTDVTIATIGTCEEATADTTFALAGGEMDITWEVGLMEDRGTAVDLTPASYTIDATPPEAGDAAIHWRCGALGVPLVQAPLNAGASATLATETGTDYRCDWFVVPATGEPGEQPESIANVVRVAAIACPEGTDPAAGFAALASACPVPVEGRPDVTFEITDPGGSFSSRGSTFDAGGFTEFEFTNAPLGQIRVTQKPIEGYGTAAVWCSDTGAGDLGVDGPVAVNGVVTWLRQPDATAALTCVFFNIPGPPIAMPAASPQATPVAGDTALATPVVADAAAPGTLYVISHLCPAGVELAGDAATMDAACQGAPVGQPMVSYSLVGQGNGVWFKASLTSSNAEGVADADFEEVKPGSAVLKQEIPEGYTAAMVFCGDGAPGEATFGEPNSWNEGTILEITPGATITCVFYNVTPADT